MTQKYLHLYCLYYYYNGITDATKWSFALRSQIADAYLEKTSDDLESPIEIVMGGSRRIENRYCREK